MTEPLLTRFAPAPTGRLHLGHVVSAIHVWGLAQRLGAVVLLRIEDHDAQRSRPEFETAILDDLDWLGFGPDRYPTAAFRAGPCLSRQSDRQAIHTAAATRLQARGLVYGCNCSRQVIAAQQPGGADAPAYPGTCRHRGIRPSEGVTWRVKLEPGEEIFVDLLQGRQVHDPARRQGDLAIRDRHGNWTYSFAVVVDDLEQGIGLVVRGDDLREVTGAHVRLGRMLGRAAPAQFAHHPIIMKSPERKLSKADGDSGVADLRRAGWSPGRVIGHAAAIAGLAPAGHEIHAADAGRLFGTVQSISR
jgi:glutamyl-tRNA synthetase/glutamyl-Q tRNA(Asp) synthetase